MPHCIIEHSPDFDSQQLNDKVLQGAIDSTLFPDTHNIKVRSQVYQTYQTGERVQAFIHVMLRILTGRSDEEKSYLSQSVIQQLQTLELTDTSLTVEVVEMDRNCYSKVVFP